MTGLGRTGFVGRFKPLHEGSARALDELCARSDHAIIGIGSAGTEYKYNARNPFTPLEVRGMIDAYLAPRHSNYSIIEIPDFAHLPGNEDGHAWAAYAREAYGPLDTFVTGNPFVERLLTPAYQIIHPSLVVPRERWIRLCATQVRLEMARGDRWEPLVPPEVAAYIKERGLDERFRREFGLATLGTLIADTDPLARADEQRERANAQEVSAW